MKKQTLYSSINFFLYAAGFGLIYLTSLYSFLLFHTLIELITIVIGSAIFILTWNTRNRTENHYLVFIGIAFLFVSIIDLVHTLSYKGMDLFVGFDANLPAQLWIAARALQAFSFLTALLFLHRKIRAYPVLAGFSVVTAGLLASIFFRIFPDCYVEGNGLTQFKIVAEYVISLILIISTVLFYRSRMHFDKKVAAWFIAALLCTVASELIFTSYTGVSDASNILGHFFTLIAFGFIYKAIIETGINQPQDLFFRKLQESEKNFRALIESSPIPMIISSKNDQDTVYVNRKFTEVFGYTLEDIPDAESWWQAAYPDPLYREEISNTWNLRVEDAIQSQSEIKPVEAKITTKSGEEKTCISYLSSIGEINLVVCQDISELKTVIEALQQSEQNFRLLIDSLPVPLALINSEQKTEYLNPKFTETFGYTRQDIPDTETWSRQAYPDPEYRDEIERSWQESTIEAIRNKKEIKANDVQVVCKDGSQRIVEGRLSQIGRKLLLLYNDVTERKQMEDALQTERELLKQRIEQRTQELRYANENLSRAARMKDEFLAAMSHELRTPLNSILGLAEVLQEQIYGSLNDQQLRYMKIIEDSGQHLLALINDILDVSKFEAGEMTLNNDMVNVVALSQSSLKFIENIAAKKNIHIKTQFDPQVETMSADPRRLKQILVNLLSNAVKFTPEGGTIGLEVEGNVKNATVDFTVWDTGIGIAQKDLKQLFKPFIQLDSSLSRSYEGTGLGLALVYRLVQLHGGSVNVTSEINQGSRFTITMPWKMRSPTKEEIETKKKGTAPLTWLKRALIIEDSPEASEQITRYLESWGVQSSVYPKGNEAFEEALQLKPDVIILDILLPGENGWDVLKKLKQHAETQKIPVVVITIVDDPEKAKALGATAYLVKPISRQDLSWALNDAALEKRKATAKLSITLPGQEQVDTRQTILLAEDNPANIQMVSTYLEACGYRVITAKNGADALLSARLEMPSLILMDIQMPDMNGLEAIRRMRTDPALEHLPVIALTALTMPGDRERSLEAGANEYISKPFSLKKLAILIQDMLEQ